MQLVEERTGARDRQQHQIVHREAWEGAQALLAELRALRQEAPTGIEHAIRVRLRAHPPQERVGLQTRAGADRAKRVGAIARKQHPYVHLVGLGLEPAEKACDAVPDARPGLSPAHPLRLAFQHPMALLRVQIAERDIERNTALLCVLLDVVLTVVEAR